MIRGESTGGITCAARRDPRLGTGTASSTGMSECSESEDGRSACDDSVVSGMEDEGPDPGEEVPAVGRLGVESAKAVAGVLEPRACFLRVMETASDDVV